MELSEHSRAERPDRSLFRIHEGLLTEQQCNLLEIIPDEEYLAYILEGGGAEQKVNITRWGSKMK